MIQKTRKAGKILFAGRLSQSAMIDLKKSKNHKRLAEPTCEEIKLQYIEQNKIKKKHWTRLLDFIIGNKTVKT